MNRGLLVCFGSSYKLQASCGADLSLKLGTLRKSFLTPPLPPPTPSLQCICTNHTYNALLWPCRFDGDSSQGGYVGGCNHWQGGGPEPRGRITAAIMLLETTAGVRHLQGGKRWRRGTARCCARGASPDPGTRARLRNGGVCTPGPDHDPRRRCCFYRLRLLRRASGGSRPFPESSREGGHGGGRARRRAEARGVIDRLGGNGVGPRKL